MSIVKVNYLRLLYDVKRATLVFMIEENLMSLSYDGFKTVLQPKFLTWRRWVHFCD